MRIGELFAGYGGLGMGVQAAYGGHIAWVSEIDPAANQILAHRLPGVPNHGDITRIDWTQVEPVDILTGGSPCQDLSHAGKRQGMTEGTRSNLWVAMREAIAHLRPQTVVWENVRGAYSAEADSVVEPCRDVWEIPDTEGLFCEHLAVFSETFPTSGTTRAGTAYAQPTSEPPTDDSESLSLLSTLTMVSAEHPGRVKIKPGQQTCLSAEVMALLPTMSASDTNGTGEHGTGGLDLRTAIAQLGESTGQPLPDGSAQ